jgi:hypothetical protein
MWGPEFKSSAPNKEKKKHITKKMRKNYQNFRWWNKFSAFCSWLRGTLVPVLTAKWRNWCFLRGCCEGWRVTTTYVKHSEQCPVCSKQGSKWPAKGSKWATKTPISMVFRKPSISVRKPSQECIFRTKWEKQMLEVSEANFTFQPVYLFLILHDRTSY